jgi:hypothetical protein
MVECMYKSTFFLTSALVGVEWSASRPCHFTPMKRAPGTRWILGWVDPRAGLDDLEKRKFFTLSELELRPLGRPSRSQSLYRLRYPGSYCIVYQNKNKVNYYIGLIFFANGAVHRRYTCMCIY